MDEKADVSNSHDSCAVEDGVDDALHVVGLLLDSVLSGVVTKRTATTEKKKTVKFTSEQKERMERAFSEEKFIKGAKLANLTQEVGLTKEQVSRWFMHRREAESKRKKNHIISKTDVSLAGAKVDQENSAERGLKSLKKKSRFSPTDLQRVGLEKAFAEERFVGKEKKACLAESLGLGLTQVARWFRSQRKRMRDEAFVRGGKEEGKKFPHMPTFTDEQREELEKAFAESRCVGKIKMAHLTQNLGLNKKQVSKWFKDQRVKARKENSDEPRKTAASAYMPIGPDHQQNGRLPEQQKVTYTATSENGYSQTNMTICSKALDRNTLINTLLKNISNDPNHKGKTTIKITQQKYGAKSSGKTMQAGQEHGNTMGCQQAMSEEAQRQQRQEHNLQHQMPIMTQQVCPAQSQAGCLVLQEEHAVQKQEAQPPAPRQPGEAGEAREKNKMLGKDISKWQFTVQQREKLEKAFSENKNATGKELSYLAEKIQVSEKQVQNWFKNKRKRNGKQVTEVVVIEPGLVIDTGHALVQEKKILKANLQKRRVEKTLAKDQIANLLESSKEKIEDAHRTNGDREEKNGGKESSRGSKKYTMSALQAAGLAEAFAKEEYIVGGKVASLAENLQLSKKQVVQWFSGKRNRKRKKEAAAIGKMVAGVGVWPTPLALDNNPCLQPDGVDGAVSAEVRKGGLTEQAVFTKESSSESELLANLAEHIGRVESKVEEVMASETVPLLSFPLSQQEMLHCLARLNNAPWSLGSSASLLLVITDQVKWNSNSRSLRHFLSRWWQRLKEAYQDFSKLIVSRHEMLSLSERRWWRSILSRSWGKRGGITLLRFTQRRATSSCPMEPCLRLRILFAATMRSCTHWRLTLQSTSLQRRLRLLSAQTTHAKNSTPTPK